MKITNVKVLNRIELAKELKHNFRIPTQIIWEMVNQLDRSEKDEVLDFSDKIAYVTRNNITFDFVNREEYVYEEPYSTFVNEKNELENKFGLTQAEMWFNTLSDEHKKNVQEISGFWSIGPASASLSIEKIPVKLLLKLNRYRVDIEYDENEDNSNPTYTQTPSGEFVRWSDIQTLINK